MKIKGFTILEISVSLILGILILGFGAFMIGISGKQVDMYSSTTQPYLSLSLLNSRLVVEVETASEITRNYNEITFWMPNKRSIKYTFENENIVRSQEHLRDTFSFKNIEFNTFYNTNPTSEHIIDHIKIDLVTHNNDYINMNFVKKYDPSFEINETLLEFD